MSRLALGGRPNQAGTVFPRTLTHPTDGTRPGGVGGPPLTAGTTVAPDQSIQPFHPNLPGGQQHNQIISSLGTPPGPSIQDGQYRTAIYNGVLPDFKIEEASGYMRRPLASPAMAGVTPQQQNELGAQFQDLMRSKTMAGDIDLRRGAAETQADLGLRRQIAMADAGLQGGNLMARLNEGQMAASLPFRNLLLQLLG